uniref:Small ribosomal subunit protein uS5m N-terminal domain-containing protein n=1 Tax=Glossina palpalis gambiensis TaxID=67801 RepID=A0A1B0B9V1_9MUSC
MFSIISILLASSCFFVASNVLLRIILKLRDCIGGFKVMKINPIDRGWSGTKMAGRSKGTPDP